MCYLSFVKLGLHLDAERRVSLVDESHKKGLKGFDLQRSSKNLIRIIYSI